jgi:hypothetical protein
MSTRALVHPSHAVIRHYLRCGKLDRVCAAELGVIRANQRDAANGMLTSLSSSSCFKPWHRPAAS